jgi:hypothetical protein
MTTHCDPNDNQAIVSYRFSDSTNGKITIKNVPIEVEVFSIPDVYSISGTCRPPGQVQQFRTFNNIRTYTITEPGAPGDSYNYQTLTMYYTNGGSEFVYCRESDLRIEGSGGIDCRFRISYGTAIMFEKIGKCPCDYSVVCGKECPKGTVKCYSTNYPGYCCLPCEPTKQSIIGIKNIVKTVNKKAVSNG